MPLAPPEMKQWLGHFHCPREDAWMRRLKRRISEMVTLPAWQIDMLAELDGTGPWKESNQI